eukprot:XP_012819539.1 PREDICTED: uncharacterized protein LOC101732444 [Xenopus tropicalis]
MFQKNVETELSLLHETISDLPSRNNLTKKEKRALNILKNDHDIVIRKADKGGQIVILNKSDYVFEAHRQLSDRETYLPLEKSPLNLYASELDALLQEALSFNIIDDKLIAFIKNDTPKSAIFHHLPKIHKKERPPVGRPIIAGIGSLGENLCEFIDHFLQPLVLRLPSYLRDSEIFDRFKGAKVFSKLDFQGAYNLICIQQGDGFKFITSYRAKTHQGRCPIQILLRWLLCPSCGLYMKSL